MKSIEYEVLQQLLVRDSDLDGLARRTVFTVPTLDQRDVERATCPAGTHVERSRRPEQRNAVGCVVGVQRTVEQERLDVFAQFELFVVFRQKVDLRVLNRVPVRDWVDERIEVEGRQVGILGLNEHHVGSVVP